MKARIFTTTLLVIFALATFAQTSRRGDREKEKNTRTQENKNNEKKSENTRESRRVEQNKEQKADAQKATENNQTERRREATDNNQPERKREASDNNQTERKREANGITQTQQRNENVDNKDSKRTYPVENRRTEPTQNNRVNERRDDGNNRNDGRKNEQSSRVVVGNQTSQRHREYVQINRAPRKVVVVNHPRHYQPVSVEYRRTYRPYRVPAHREIFWSISFRNDFSIYYPEVRYWRYDVGYRLPLIPAYDAYDYVGDAARVYGKVFEVHYEYDTDEYFVYFGDYYPYHDFSIIIPGNEARLISRRPERTLRRANIEVTGYITEFDDKPEMVIRNARQIDLY
jgi:hypothetical protein